MAQSLDCNAETSAVVRPWTVAVTAWMLLELPAQRIERGAPMPDRDDSARRTAGSNPASESISLVQPGPRRGFIPERVKRERFRALGQRERLEVDRTGFWPSQDHGLVCIKAIQMIHASPGNGFVWQSFF